MKRLLAIAAALLIIAPAAAVAAGGTFTDDDSSIFEANIEWLAGAGVTLGCNPPTNDNFCPDDNVTRGQMAAFMQRFAQFLGAEDGQVAKADDADTVGGLTPEDLLDASPVVLAAADFNPDGGGTYGEYYLSWFDNGWVLGTDVPGMCLQAPVSLPHGAEVTSAEVIALDSTGVGLYKFHTAVLGDNATLVETSGTSVASPDPQIVTIDLTGMTASASNQNWIGVCLNNVDDVLYGARVFYTVTDAPTGAPAQLQLGTRLDGSVANGS